MFVLCSVFESEKKLQIMTCIRPLNKGLSFIAKNELNEAPTRLTSDLQAIKEWLEKTSHINAQMDDQFLVAFLRGCKFSLERAKDKLEAYYTMRTSVPEIMENRDPLHEKTLGLLKLGIMLSFPKTNKSDSPIITLIRIGLQDPEKISNSDLIALSMINLDILLTSNDNYVVAGQIIVVDMEQLKLAHLLNITADEIKRSILLNTDVIPIRNKAIHFINVPSIFLPVIGVIKSLIPQKLFDRLIIHKNLESLHKHIPTKLLPSEYGGDSGPLSDMIDNWEKIVLNERDNLLEQKKYGVDESKRLIKTSFNDTMEGSFRRLAVD